MKKFNILCTLLLGIMFVSVVYELYSAGYSFGRGWYLADELIKKDTPTMEMAINRCELEGKKTFSLIPLPMSRRAERYIQDDRPLCMKRFTNLLLHTVCGIF
ncbi:hypothetical protein [Prevotella bivia]|uniref:Uncharacterized protein n=1 Tax=Prevotella bivia TaxID=28125 RepID=A0A137SYQ5_9BACT|nr:hypothetical protein [Prevotella bivia]KXO17537.1 hypothetical protein HMPREF3202_00992 [Prevotella bivia]